MNYQMYICSYECNSVSLLHMNSIIVSHRRKVNVMFISYLGGMQVTVISVHVSAYKFWHSSNTLKNIYWYAVYALVYVI